MDSRTPPKLVNGPGLAASKQARADFFALLQRRDRTPKTVEVVREVEVERIVHVEVPVEVVREVEVEKIVYVDRPVEAAPADVQIPEFLRYDPLSEFLANEQAAGESDEATLTRLRVEIVELLALQRDGGLTAEEEARLRYLTAHIKPMGD